VAATGSVPPIGIGKNGKWDLAAARSVQADIARAVVEEDPRNPIRSIGGADVAYDRRERLLYAAIVVLEAASLETIETATYVGPALFPYVPGYLSFREAPAILEAWARLRNRPDLLIVDAHGRAHPRRAGLACHVGVLLDLPVIGVAKSVLVGEPGEPGHRRGSTAALLDRGERVGAVVRTRDGVAPVYVSVGHRIRLETAVRWVLSCGRGFRLPEPTRRAHQVVGALGAGRALPVSP